eukprot:1156328-Pelagomonas_calceolata.AAC.7
MPKGPAPLDAGSAEAVTLLQPCTTPVVIPSCCITTAPLTSQDAVLYVHQCNLNVIPIRTIPGIMPTVSSPAPHQPRCQVHQCNTNIIPMSSTPAAMPSYCLRSY